MIAPRFLLVLSAQANVLRATLVTRDLRLVASAHLKFELQDTSFDPAEVWYKTKKVIAACFDIGRTQARELVGIVLVTRGSESVVWRQVGNEVQARGSLENTDRPGTTISSPDEYRGTLAAWLLWNLTGVYAVEGTADFGKTRARAPFDTELVVIAAVTEVQALARMGQGSLQEWERVCAGAAQLGWEKQSTG